MTNSNEPEIQQVLNKIEESKRVNDTCIAEIRQLKQTFQKYSRRMDEILWADILNFAVKDSIWLKDGSFSPGRAAVGFPFLYAMYHVLNDACPKSILEMGLGQTTKMIGQYAAYIKADHYVVEHDSAWIEFFKKGSPLSEFTRIVLLETITEPYLNKNAIRTYNGFEQAFSGKKFDLICIDAPFGYDMPYYSRIDILKILPECLNQSFVIMIDDYERTGEKNTVNEIKKVLNSHAIKFSSGIYSGDKDSCLICSSDLSFLCTL